MVFHFRLCSGFDQWQAAVADWLRAEPAVYSLVSAIAQHSDGKGAWCAVLEQDGQPALAMAQTPPWPVMLAGPCEPDDTAVETVLAGWRSAGVVAPGVNGPEPWIRALVSASDRTVHDEMGLRLHLLDGKPRCAHPASGRARCAEEADIPMLQTWEDAFVAEVEADGNPPPTTADEVRQRLEHYLLWDDDGLRSMVRRTRPQLGGWSISGVYTPPEYRGHGYAGSVVHAMCERLVREGASYQALYTDLANPTSNHIYREIGFVPAGDQVRVLWTL